MPTAHALLALYRDNIANLPPDIAEEVGAAQRALSVAQDAADEALTRLDLARERATAAGARVDLYIAERNDQLLLALHCKTDADGCPVPRQGAPRGPRQKQAEPQPADPPTPDSVTRFAAAVSDPGPDEPLTFILTRLRDPSISDWTNEIDTVSETAIRVIDRHRIGAGEAQAIEDDRVKVDGRWWTMADEPRVVA